MNFAVRQSFTAPPADVIDLYCDPSLYPHLDGLGKLGSPEVLDRDATADRIRMQVRYRFVADLPTAALAIVQPDRLTWIEDTTYDLQANSSATTIRPDHYADRLTASARSTFRARGDDCERVIDGDLRVRALLVAGQVERAIVSGMTEHLDAEAIVVSRLLG